MNKKTFAAALAIVGLGGAAPAAQAQEPPRPAIATVETMTLRDGALDGPGADRLLERLPGAQFVLIGEDHGFADAPDIALALARAGARHGFDHHVAEVGPMTDRIVSDLLKKGGPDDLAALLQDRPLAAPFINMREDAVLADYFIDRARRRTDAFWGVDQEFIGSPLLHFETLKDMARNEAARAMAESLLASEQDAFSSGRQDAAFMMTATPETFDALRAAFPRSPRASEIIDALEASAGIYQAYAAGRNFESNASRIAYLRAQFLDAYRNAPGDAPRALFKFGAIHMGRGTTFLNTFDLGSLTEGIAAGNGLDVLRVAFMPLEGRQTIVRPSPDGAFRTIDMRSENVAGFLGLLGVDESSIPEDGYAVISMEEAALALEQRALSQLPEEVRFFLLGFDYLITTRGARAATPLAR